ncbi:hypothetical protein [Siminovitchia terrae]|nr:hypothetical protein [Siminovitchia terrae]
MYFEEDFVGGVEERCEERESERRSRLVCFCREVADVRQEVRL